MSTDAQSRQQTEKQTRRERSPASFRGLVLAVLLIMPAALVAQERSPAAYIQISASMRDMQNPIMAGWVEGSLYNGHPSKAIRIVEVAVNSSHGKRIFRFDCVVGSYESKEFSLSTGFRLDFRNTAKDWWNLVVTRANWTDGAGLQRRCPE